MDGGAGLFAPGNRAALEASFKAFAARPEHRPLLEAHQRDEVAAALALQEASQIRALEAEVAALDAADRRALAPVLGSPVLRQLLVGLASDGAPSGGGAAAAPGGGGLQGWLANPRVLQLLRAASKALRRGAISEQQLCGVLRAERARDEQARAGEPAAAPHQATLPSHLLVEALNEHLAERHAGNAAFRRADLGAALHHYSRALAIVSFVVGASADDQAEVEANRAAVQLNIAAVHLAQQDFGAAVAACDEVLAGAAVRGEAGGEVAVKAWLRRSKANAGRHEYGVRGQGARAAAGGLAGGRAAAASA
ncbi:hypothetical protein HT031_000981 [Scenedesmus sp. PABB004]|nr:hypothetical protein HT031_000981 [Scenedesmus sp. PABB004]